MGRCKTATQCDRQHGRYRQRIEELEAENQRLREAIDSAIPYLEARHTRIPLRFLSEALQEGWDE
jgi:septal ring factor EnvC (AmiA/AmiB activator)